MKLKYHIIPIILSIVLMLVNYPTLSGIHQTLAIFISPIYYLIDIPKQFYDWVTEQGQDKETLMTQLRLLNHENLTLKMQLQAHNAILLELKKLKKILNVNYRIEQGNTTLASISNITRSRFQKQFTINQGQKDNIKVGQAVIGSLGIIGQIINTTYHHSTVLSTVDPTHYISVKSQRNNFRTIAQGVASYDNKLQLNFVPTNTDVKLGDIFISSGLDNIFPKNHPVAIVSRIDNTDNTFMSIKLMPIEDINKLEFILVVGNHE